MKIEKRMKQLKITRAELADKAGISRGYLSDLLNGRRGERLGMEVMLKLASALEVDPLFFSKQFANANKGHPVNRKSGHSEVSHAASQ